MKNRGNEEVRHTRKSAMEEVRDIRGIKGVRK